MATGSLILTPGSATLPDGSASNAAPAIQRVKSSATAPGIYALQLCFDASTEEWACWQFRMPADYDSAPVAKVQYKMASATSGGVAWDVRVSATSDGDSQDVDAQDFASANVGTATVPGTAGYLDEVSVTLTNADSLAAGDFVVVRVARAVADAADTATGDAELLSCSVEYLTA
jgi:hypothetical protein